MSPGPWAPSSRRRSTACCATTRTADAKLPWSSELLLHGPAPSRTTAHAWGLPWHRMDPLATKVAPRTTQAALREGERPGQRGGAEGTRTPDPHTASVVRYQLRHSPEPTRLVFPRP